jgi:hypothetical protein
LIFNCQGKRNNLISTCSNQKSFQQPVFSNITYPEQQQIPLSYSKLPENPNKFSIDSSSLSNLDQLDINPTDQSSIDNDLNIHQSQYNTYAFPFKENDHSASLQNKKTVYEVVV